MAYTTYKPGVNVQPGQTLAFKRGKGYFARGQAVDPFAQMSPAGIRSTVAGYTAKLPQPLTDPQLQARAQGMVDPLVQAITDRIGAQSKAGAGAIGGYTGALAKSLGSAVGDTRAAYLPIEASQAASDSALADRLKGGGDELAKALSTRLAGIQAPGATDPALADIRAAGAGAGNALYGKGSASLSELLANQGSAERSAGMLPALARLGGAQSLRDLELQKQSELAQQVGDVRAQLPTIIGNLRSENTAAQTNRANAGLDIFKFLTGENTQRGIAKAGLASSASNVATTQANENARTQAQIDAANQRASTAAAARVKAAQVKAATTEAKAKQGKTLTPGEKAQLKKGAVKQADLYYYGVQPVTRADGSEAKAGVPGLNYPTAIKRLASQYSLTVAEAKEILNDYYAPGERGRPAAPLPKPTPDTGFRGADLGNP